MTMIRILPEILSNQIAAGEVVQRPASVVKELVENSIDAGAASITIEIVKGGKSFIRVSDNGRGLSRDDAILSIERYATSKINTPADLFSISTFGFRGEALPSIASVSKFSLVTRPENTDTGTRIEIIGGKIKDVSDTGAPVGTMVEVRHLFFNTPARKKFLKSDATETSHAADIVSGMALGHPQIQFRLFLNQALTRNFSSADDLYQRSVRVLGPDVAGRLYQFDSVDGDVRVCGYCSHPSVSRSTASKIFLFVNNRMVYDRGIISAVFKGYKGSIMKGRFPLAVIFVQIPFDHLDVNVHPSKREIKFFDSRSVYRAVSQAVNSILSSQQRDLAAYSSTLLVKDDPVEYDAGTFTPVHPGQVEQSCIDWPAAAGEKTQKIFPQTTVPREAPLSVSTKKIPPPMKPSTPRVLGQVMGTYILAEGEDGLILIDQHAAHERITYETLKRRYHSLKIQSQSLAVPEILDLNFKESNALIHILDDLKAMGMEIEPFGETSFVIKAVPLIIDEQEIKPIILDILDAALVKKDGFSKEEWLDKCLILMACHGAIRANLTLDKIEMETLLADLEQCENPRHCPHGRPIVLTWSKHQIEKLFKRVV